MSSSVELSVVVALISGRTADVRMCLGALAAQARPPSREILVPYDDACADVVRLQNEFPDVRFLRAVGLDTTVARAGASREHHDTLRTMGLRAARGEVIALIEDHARPSASWCDDLLAALGRHPGAGALGGAVECGSRTVLARAAWLCDFGRYQNPLPEATAVFVSDSNVAYRRRALEQVASAWAGDYHETVVHDAMAAAGFELWTTPRAVVWQERSGFALGPALRERYVWGRSYAGTRARLIGRSRRWVLAALTPALPAVLTWRVARTSLARKGRDAGLWTVLPAVLVLHAAWAAGELAGYVTGAPD